MKLAGKVALVTGGSRGIGRAVSIVLAREGAAIVVNYGSDDKAAERTVNTIKAMGQRAMSIKADVSQVDKVKDLVDKTIAEMGKIDILVTCHSICPRTQISDVSEEEWDRVINVNLKGPFFTIKAVLPYMKKQGGGKIVVIGSLAGKTGGLIAGPAYVASKGAVHALVKHLAKALAPQNVYVNGIVPGMINTEMIQGFGYQPDWCPLNRIGEPEDIAEPVLFLVSDASNYMTGTLLDVTGGIFTG